MRSINAIDAPTMLPTIRKRDLPPLRAPYMPDYAAERARFEWARARAAMAGLAGGGLNMGYEARDRHVAEGRGREPAVCFVDRQGGRSVFTFEALQRASNRCAHALASLGVRRGDRVFSLLGRSPELHGFALGALRSGLVYCPLFTAFGPEPVHTRLALGKARALITTDALYARKVAPMRARLPDLEHILLVRTGHGALPPGTLDWQALLDAAPESFEVARTRPEDPALLHFTSGTTGQPKGVLHCTMPWWPSTRARASRSTCRRAIATGARRIRAESPGSSTACSRRCSAA